VLRRAGGVLRPRHGRLARVAPELGGSRRARRRAVALFLCGWSPPGTIRYKSPPRLTQSRYTRLVSSLKEEIMKLRYLGILCAMWAGCGHTPPVPVTGLTPEQGHWVTASGNLEIAIAPCDGKLCG